MYLMERISIFDDRDECRVEEIEEVDKKIC